MNRSLVVIPAFNEERQIVEVIDAAQAVESGIIADQIVVVDNNSTDKTPELAKIMGAKVLHCMKQGKGWAMDIGVSYAQDIGAPSVTFLDGDLIGLTPEQIEGLAEPVLNGDYVMNIGYLGERTQLQKSILQYWGGFSGQRSIWTGLWNHVRTRDLKKWRTEAALNRICAHRNLGDQIKRTELAGVSHLGTFDGSTRLVAGSLSYARKYASATYGLTTSSGKPCPTEVNHV